MRPFLSGLAREARSLKTGLGLEEDCRCVHIGGRVQRTRMTPRVALGNVTPRGDAATAQD